MRMRKYIKLVLVLSTIFFAVPFYDAKVFAGNSETEKYERDYLSKVFDSENGLEGTTANCICADQDGFLWLGGYTGLYRYDGNEFKKFLMDGRALPVNDIVQDQDGILWVGTNGEGVYHFDGKNFQEYKLDNEVQGTSVVNKLYLDQEGTVWVGTKGGLFSIDAAGEADRANEYRKFSNSIIQDIGELSTGEKIIIQKSGGVYLLEKDAVKRLDLDFGESIEEGCEDYQGNYWFVSSRQGVLQLYENYFSDLGAYWGISQTVNSIQPYENRIYVGCDDGLYCYEGKKQVKDKLVRSCKGQRTGDQ